MIVDIAFRVSWSRLLFDSLGVSIKMALNFESWICKYDFDLTPGNIPTDHNKLLQGSIFP